MGPRSNKEAIMARHCKHGHRGGNPNAKCRKHAK